MDAAADGEFSDFMAGRWSALVRLGYGLTGDVQHAEDLAQTAFALAYAGPARVTKSIGSGVVDGTPWHATASIGPWGWCYTFADGDACYGVVPDTEVGNQHVSMITCSPATGDAPATGIAFAAPGVTRVVLRFSVGTSASFRAVVVAGSRAFGYAVPAHVRVTSSHEYGSRGQIIGSTPGSAVGSERTPGWSC